MDSIFKCPSGQYIDLSKLVSVGTLDVSDGLVNLPLHFQLMDKPVLYLFVNNHQTENQSSFITKYITFPAFALNHTKNDWVEKYVDGLKNYCEKERQTIINAWMNYKKTNGLNT